MSWEALEKIRKESSDYISLKDGQFIEGVFIGQPYPFYYIYKNKSEFTEKVPGASFRFRINFAVRENDTWKIKIFSGGATLRDLILDAKEEFGLATIFKIKRTGSTKDDTRYSIFPSKISLTEKDKITIKALDKFILKASKIEQYDDYTNF